jgi:hypothetical protein
VREKTLIDEDRPVPSVDGLLQQRFHLRDLTSTC